jgi:hypothetical protein
MYLERFDEPIRKLNSRIRGENLLGNERVIFIIGKRRVVKI